MTIKKTVALVVSALLCISILSGYAEKQEDASIAQKDSSVEAESATKVVG